MSHTKKKCVVMLALKSCTHFWKLKIKNQCFVRWRLSPSQREEALFIHPAVVFHLRDPRCRHMPYYVFFCLLGHIIGHRSSVSWHYLFAFSRCWYCIKIDRLYSRSIWSGRSLGFVMLVVDSSIQVRVKFQRVLHGDSWKLDASFEERVLTFPASKLERR